jgi:regulator of sigma E protease
MLLTIITFIAVLVVLVMVHELGHFIAAKMAGVYVKEFAFGFPPRLLSKKYKGTRYSINAIPLGGYVTMLGELEEHPDPRAFENQSRFKRFIISIAGVIMNIFLAWLILDIGFTVGMAPIVSSAKSIPGTIQKSEVMVAEVITNSPADQIGLKPGDIITGAKIDGNEIVISSIEELSNFSFSSKGKDVTLYYKSAESGEDIAKNVIISNDADAPLGVVVIEQGVVRVPWYKAPYVAFREVVKIFQLTFLFLKKFFVRAVFSTQIVEGIGGPVAIYTYTGTAVKAGAMAILQFIAILSTNLALVNILPFPALDGGRIFFVLSEVIARRKLVKQRAEQIIHSVGFVLLILMVAMLTYKDVLRLIIR